MPRYRNSRMGQTSRPQRPLERGNAKRGLDLLNDGPWTLVDLEHVVAEADLPALASAWPALLADAISHEGEASVGQITRVANVIAERLGPAAMHGVRGGYVEDKAPEGTDDGE